MRFKKKNISSKSEDHRYIHDRFVPKADRKLRKVFREIGVPETASFIPDDFQIEAVEKIMESDVLVSAPTGSGKTWIAVEAMKRVLSEGKRIWYATPLKALSNSKYHEFGAEFGEENVGVITGDRKENTDAKIVVGTTEILRNQLYDSMGKSSDFKADLVVLDEAHFLGDKDRGVVWEEVMIYLPTRVRLLMLSATIQNDKEIAAWLKHVRKHPCHVVHSDKRPVPIYPLYLLPNGEIMPLSGLDGITPKIDNFLKYSQKNRLQRSHSTISYEHILNVLEKFNLLPAVFFLKSRYECNSAIMSCKKRIVSSEKSRILKKRLDYFLEEYPFLSSNDQLQYVIYHALGSHHGGQLPHLKVVVEKLMNEGLLDAIFSTSTVAAGVNFPARTVVLVQSDRFNGKEFVSLSATDLHQATGRAGRRGKDKIGFVVLIHGPFQDPHLIDELLANPPDPIDSQIKINFSMCLNLLLSQTPEEIRKLLNVSFATFQNVDSLRELEARKTEISEKLRQKMNGCRCESSSDIISRIQKRRSVYKELTRLKKMRKKYLKGYYKADLRIEDDERVLDLNRKIESVSGELREIPCDGCYRFTLCHRGKSNHFTKLAYETKQVSESFEEARNYLWNEFSRHLDFLILNGFAGKDGRLTDDGIWASKLRLGQPLIIAELIRKGLLNELTPELLSGIIAVFVNDKFRDIDIDPSVQWNKKPLLKAYYKMKDEIEEIMSLKKKHNFEVPQIQFWPAAALYAWACGESWENVIQLTSVDEGDLAMMIFRTADNLRQIKSLDKTHPELAFKAGKCIGLLLREPVVIPT